MSVDSDPNAEFLRGYFFDPRRDESDDWQHIPAPFANWMVVVLSEDERKMLLAVRTSFVSQIDSFSLSDDPKDGIGHMCIGADTSFIEAVSDVNAQTEMGLWVPNDVELGLLEELAVQVQLMRDI